MTISTVGANAVGTTATPTPTAHNSQLDSTQFMMLLMQELRNQNPMDPVSDKDFMAQMAQMNSLQELQKMNGTLTDLATGNHLGEAAGLIGRQVGASLASGQKVSGVVTGVTLVSGEVMLLLGSQQVPFSGLTSVSEAGKTNNA